MERLPKIGDIYVDRVNLIGLMYLVLSETDDISENVSILVVRNPFLGHVWYKAGTIRSLSIMSIIRDKDELLV